MKDYNRMTKRNYFEGDYSVVPEELSKEITKWKEQHATEITAPPVWYHLGERLCQLEDKIENGTMVEIKTIAKILNNTFGCPCDYGLDVYAVSHYDDWCKKSCGGVCDADNYTACWETYLTTKLRELKGERE
jgi:hypothetical protein